MLQGTGRLFECLPWPGPYEMVTSRVEIMAESSKFKKKVHFGGTVGCVSDCGLCIDGRD